MHLTPVVWKNRLFIFWPEFVEKQKEATISGETAETLSKKKVSTLKSTKYWEVRLGSSEYIDGKWSSKQLTKEFLKLEKDVLPEHLKEITLKTDRYKNKIYLWTNSDIVDRNDGWKWWVWDFGSFIFSDIQSKVEVSNNGFEDLIGYDSTIRYDFNFQKLSTKGALQHRTDTYLNKSIAHNLLFENNTREADVNEFLFFYSDQNRTYFVRPVNVEISQYVENPGFYPPIITELTTAAYHQVAQERQVTTGNNTGAISGNGPGVAETDNNYANILNTQNFDIPFGGVANKRFGSWVSMVVDGLEFNTFYHPFSSQYVTSLNSGGIKALMETDTNSDYNDSGSVFVDSYEPNFEDGFIKKAPESDDYSPGAAYTFYKENICFDVYGANSIYNWELFFHAPLYIATRLSKNGKYEEAMKWFHYIFDPASSELPVEGQDQASQYWKVLPFKYTPAENLQNWFMNLGLDDSVENGIGEWRDNPFKPHLVARNFRLLT